VTDVSIYTPRAGTGAVHIGGRSTGRPLLPQGWPVLALFGLYPLWWVLGISEFSGILFAIPMAIQLVQTPRVRAPRGFGIWVLFLVWAAVGIFVLQVDAPGAVADTSSGRYVTFLYRFLWYISVSVILLYVGNMRDVITLPRLFRAMSYMFITIVCGGYLGLIAPHFEFPSVLELVLPHSIGHQGFVQDLIHPVAAQVQTFLGYEEGRPSAPFAYTNDWGLNFACFLPAFVVSWCRRDAGWRRWVGAAVLFAAFIPVVYSLNRGLWGALAAMFIFVAVKFALSGRFLMIGAFLGVVVVLVATVILSPLGSLVSQRLDNGNSNQGRTNLGTLTITSMATGSPIIGFGSTRNVSGNFNSIAAGSTVKCPRCTPPPLGTQGQFSLVIFSTGFGGIFLYLAFFLRMFIGHIRLKTPYAVAALCVLVAQFVTMPVYTAIGPGLAAFFIAIGVLWRSETETGELEPDGTAPPRLRAAI
jgi:hypothetical protein